MRAEFTGNNATETMAAIAAVLL